jgi:hypothetical protein
MTGSNIAIINGFLNVTLQRQVPAPSGRAPPPPPQFLTAGSNSTYYQLSQPQRHVLTAGGSSLPATHRPQSLLHAQPTVPNPFSTPLSAYQRFYPHVSCPHHLLPSVLPILVPSLTLSSPSLRPVLRPVPRPVPSTSTPAFTTTLARLPEIPFCLLAPTLVVAKTTHSSVWHA